MGEGERLREADWMVEAMEMGREDMVGLKVDVKELDGEMERVRVGFEFSNLQIYSTTL